jgi:hypothetical protein
VPNTDHDPYTAGVVGRLTVAVEETGQTVSVWIPLRVYDDRDPPAGPLNPQTFTGPRTATPAQLELLQKVYRGDLNRIHWAPYAVIVKGAYQKSEQARRGIRAAVERTYEEYSKALQ